VSLELRARPLERPIENIRARRAPYRASWASVVSMLRSELTAIGAKRAVIEMAVRETDLRNDGWIRSTARPEHAGVRITFVSRHGELSYEAATWSDWTHNIYAIARTLRAQRMMARDGAVKGDQVYRGFKALPGPGPSEAGTKLREEAARELLGLAGYVGDAEHVRRVLTEPPFAEEVFREASKRHHPDKGGSAETMSRINTLRSILRGGVA
jgi:hypothetical protein